MGEKNRFRNIAVGIAFIVPDELRIAASGERLKDWQEQFNDLYFDRITQAISHKKWGVQFGQIDINSETFVVDIFVDDPHEFKAITGIIKENPMRDVEFQMMEPYWSFQKFLELTKQQTPAQ